MTDGRLYLKFSDARSNVDPNADGDDDDPLVLLEDDDDPLDVPLDRKSSPVLLLNMNGI